MLTEKELGAAIEAARKLKGVTKKALAERFGVTPPAVQDWVNRGTISKSKLTELWGFFSDVVGPDHWGLSAFPWGSSQAQHPSGEITPEDAVAALATHLAGVPERTRKVALSILQGLVESPHDAPEIAAEVAELLSAAKRRAA